MISHSHIDWVAPEQNQMSAIWIPTGKWVALGIPHSNSVVQKWEEAEHMGVRKRSPFLFQCPPQHPVLTKINLMLAGKEKCSTITSRQWRVTLELRSNKLVTATVDLTVKSSSFIGAFWDADNISTQEVFKKRKLNVELCSWRIYYIQNN